MLGSRGVALLVAALMLVSVACGGEETREVEVALAEWSVEAGIEESKAGTVRFEVTNAGQGPHELVVVKTDAPAHMLELVDGKVDEAKVNVAGKLGAFGAGTTVNLELKLSPGKFVLLCNIVERAPGGPVVSHYENGMYASLLLTP